MTIQRNDLPAGLRVSRLNRAVFISVLRHMLGLKKKKLAPLFHPIKSKPQTNGGRHRGTFALVFPRFASANRARD